MEKISESKPSWSAANQQYLRAELGRLRLLLQRRVLWLRKLWKRELAPELQNFQGLVITDVDADLLLASDPAAAEQAFYAEDEEAQELARRLTEQQLVIEEAMQSMIAGEGPPALEIIVRLFRLGSFNAMYCCCVSPRKSIPVSNASMRTSRMMRCGNILLQTWPFRCLAITVMAMR